MQNRNSWFLAQVERVIFAPRRLPFGDSTLRALERRYQSIRHDDLLVGDGGGCAENTAVGNSAPASDSATTDDDGDGDPDSDPPRLSPSEFARQAAAFRTSRTNFPGVTFNTKSGSFKTSFAPNGTPTLLGSFATIDEAVTAIHDAYVASGVSA